MIYEIVVRNRLSPAVAAEFADFSLIAEGGVTEIVGEIADQAALHGVIGRIEQLGLELVELHAVG